MDDAVQSAPAKLTFPHEPIDFGTPHKVAEGVYWFRSPLPFGLDHINLYLVDDGEGWTLIDTGLGDDATATMWAEHGDAILQGRPISRIICTHMHPDHIGMAGEISRRFDARLWMSRGEYLTSRVLVSDKAPAPDEAIAFYRAAGWTEEQLDRYRKRFGMYGKAVRRLPDSYRRIQDRQNIEIGGRNWRVIMGAGHSPEHVCLWQPEAKLFISGDQVLPRITPNVSVWPTEPAGDPLGDWLDACWRIMAAIPDDVLVLPSHNEPFYGLHVRLDAIIEGHEKRLERVASRLTEPKRVIDLFGAMFAKEIGASDFVMATGETLAHLSYLVHRGQARYETDEASVAWFTRCEDAEFDADD